MSGCRVYSVVPNGSLVLARRMTPVRGSTSHARFPFRQGWSLVFPPPRDLEDRERDLRSAPGGEEEADPHRRQTIGPAAEERVVPLDRLEDVDGVADEPVQAVLVAVPALALEVQAVGVGLPDEEGAEARDAPVLLAEDRVSVPDVGEGDVAQLGRGTDGARARPAAGAAIDDREGARHRDSGALQDPGAEPGVLGRRLPGHVAALVDDRPVEGVRDEAPALPVAERGVVDSVLDVLGQGHAARAVQELQVLRDQGEGASAARPARVAQILPRRRLAVREDPLVAGPEGLRRPGHGPSRGGPSPRREANR